MINANKKRVLIITAACLFSFTGFLAASVFNEDRASSRLELSVRSLASTGDYWSASKVAFELASERKRLGETVAACGALAQSLDYYRQALAKDTGVPLSEFGSGLGEDQGMREVRSKFGCGSTAA